MLHASHFIRRAVAPAVMEAAADKGDEAGGVGEVMAVAAPILGACLAEPLLSMIDTACIGRFSGPGAAVRLAALNANVAIFTFISACTYFLCTATTAVVGRAIADESSGTVDDDGESAAARSLRDSLLIASILGTILMLVTVGSHHTILARGFGLSSAMATWQPARAYLLIRAISLPAVATTLAAVGVSLGMQDSLTPLLGVVLSFAVNVVGDYILVCKLRMGLAGAAIATAAASYSGCLLIGGALVRKLRPRWLRPIDLGELLPFLQCSGALLAGTVLNAVTYTGTSSVVAAAASVSQAATHQVALNGWWLLSFASVPLSLAGQSLLPTRAKGNPDSARQTIRVLLRVGLGCAGLMAALNVALTTAAATLFTSDPVLLSTLRGLTPVVALSQACVSLATALDGVYIGCGWLAHYVGGCALGTIGAVATFLFGLRCGGGLRPAWNGLLVFTALRAVAHVLQLPRLERALRTALPYTTRLEPEPPSTTK